MATEIEYALMAGRIYQSTRATINWLPDLQSLGWTELSLQQKPSGFEAVSFQKGTEIVISFAGTGSNVDWWANAGGFFGVTTEQLRQAADYYLQVKAANPPGTIISFTGHSLGGGLASLMAVFFGETAVTFDQAPFRNSASVAVATTLKDYLLNQQGYSETALQGLTNFISAAARGGIPNESRVIDFSVQGEILSAASALRIGTPTTLTHGAPDLLLATNLHSEALLATFVQNDQFREVTFKLPDVVRMIFSSALYNFPTAGGTRNFIENLVRHQNGIAGLTLGETPTPADAMLTRFTDDLWKLAQDGGLTMTDNIPGGIFSSQPNDVSKALIAFSMQKYYDETQGSAGYKKELFTEVSGGVQFDRADVAASLGDAKGYTLYFQNYLNSSAFTNPERQLIQPMLPTLRDWYVQAGPGGMDVVDAQNHGAFMLGGNGADSLTGGSQTDLLVGNAGTDRLNGGSGNDTLLGGAGFDTYIYNTGDGNDQIEDSDAKGMVLVNGQLMVGGIRRAGEADNTYKSSDGQYTFVQSGTTLTVNGHVTIQDWQPGEFGVTLRDLSTLPTGTSAVIDYNNGWETETYTITLPFGPNNAGRFIMQNPSKNYVVNGASGTDLIMTDPGHPALYGGNEVVNAGDGSDYIIGNTNDRLFGEAGDDVIKGGRGQDVLDGGEGHDFLLADYVDAPGANDYLDGGADDDALLGGTGDDILLGGDGDDQIFADDIAGYATRPEGRDYVDGGAGDDWASGGLGDDVLLGGADKDRLYGDNAPVSDAYVWTELPWVPVGTGVPPDAFFQGFTFSIVPGVNSGFHSMTGGSDYLEGGAGDDYLQGDAGNDVLLGGTENDTLYGDDLSLDEVTPGNDLLDGNAGNDDLFGGGGTDTLLGGAGDDTLIGDFLDDPIGGNDWLDGGAGTDTLAGGQGDDILFGGADQDLLLGNEGQDMLDGGSGNDELQGGAGADVLWGGIGDDRLFGEGGNDELLGGDGNDFLSGEAGEDLLVGGAGTDMLQGGVGADTYVFNLGDGVDSIIDTPGEGNKVVLGAGISADDIGAGIGSLVLRVGVDGDAIHIQGFDPENPTAPVGIETIEFADGTTLTQADLIARGFDLMGTAGNDSLNGGETYRAIYGFDGNDFLTGGAIDNVINSGRGNDSLFGEGGIDQLLGGAGNDQLYGGTGNDTYRFNLGDGLDSISDSIDAGEPNRVVFGSGITSSSVTLTTNVGQVLVRPGAAFEGVTVGANATNALGFHAVDNFEFTDGTTLTYAQLIARGFDIDGTDGVDMLSGTSVTDRINGHGGSDSIQADAGDDTIDAGTGDDVVDAGEGNDTVMGGDGNDVLSGSAGNDTLLGGEGNDTLRGGSGDDQLLGGAGDDIMYGEGGNDLVDGGVGNDQLIGRPGTYTYAFGTGSGHDIIDSTLGGSYTIQMAAGILPNDVTVGRVGQTITLNLSGGFDTLTLPSFYVNHSFQVQFSDRTVWDATTIHNQAGDSRQVGTSEADAFFGYKGFPDELIGLAGDDYYEVNDPGDVVTEAPNEGHDIVYSSADFTLPDNVEDLRLVEPFALYEFTSIEIGTILVYVDPAALLVTGNALDNVLSGNAYDNVITGGAGDDTLYGGLAYLGGTVSTSDKDILDGGAGNDTYIYQEWSGVDTILDDSSTGDVNQVQAFNVFVDSDHLSLAVKGGALTLVFTGVNDYSAVEKTHELRIPNFNPNDAYGPHAIDLFTVTNFTGIETLTYSQLIDRGLDVYGTSQDDIVTGTNAPNRIHGGAGNDTLIGGQRNDIYFFDPGDGVDTIVDTAVAGAMNEIRFGTGLSLGELELVQGTNSLTMQIGSNGDAIVLSNYDPTGQTGSLVIGSVTFANGIHLSLEELLNFPGGTEGDDTFSGTNGPDRYNGKGGNDVITGTGGNDLLLGGSGQDDLKGDAGDDQLFGGIGNDTLTGGIGDDTIDGGAGADVYVFNPGDGHDVILDRADSGGNNHLLFGPGITLSDLQYNQVYGGQFGIPINGINIIIDGIYVGNNGDRIDLPNFRDVPPGLRTISFADGLTLDLFDYYAASLVEADQTLFVGPGNDPLIGGAGNDTLHGGTGNSVLIGGGGNNTLIGGSGSNMFYGVSEANNTVFFGTGSNALVIPGGSGSNTVTVLGVPASNTVVFGGDYASFNPHLGFGSLLIRYGSEGGELHIEGFDPNDAYANPGIGTFQFTDRTLTYQQLIDLGFDISGTDEVNVLTGSSATDRIKGLGGNDTLQSGFGTDVLEGGQGDDLLSGGMGHDTYVFNAGDGIDTIQDVASAGEGNRIQFGTGISQSDLTFMQDQVARTLTIQVGSSGADQLILTNLDPTNANGSLVAEMLAFADGSTASLAALLGGPVNHAPTVATPLVDQTVAEDTPFSVIVPANTFADEDAGDTLTLSASLADGTALPAWLTFDATTATFRGTPNDAQVGSLDLRVTATDTSNLIVSDSMTLTVTNVNDAPTVATPLADQTAAEDAPFSLVVPAGTFADVDAGDALTYSATLANGVALPTWLSFDPATRTFSGTPLNDDVGSLEVTVTATDTGILNASDTFSLTVANVNDAPTVANPILDQAAPTGVAFTLTVPTNTFADVDLGDTLTYSATLADGSALPAWLNFNSSTRTFNGTPSSGDAGLVNIKVTATDTGSLSMSDLFDLTVTIQDQVLTGTAGSDVLTGGAGHDQLFGLAGNDTLQGGAGNDLLEGGTGTDTMQGGTGHDTYLLDVSGDVVTEVANEGTDTVQSSITYTLGAHVEHLTLTGTANLNGTGNALDNMLTGNSGANVLTGGAGNDTYLVGTGDSVVESANGGTDTVQSSVTWTLSSTVENLTLTGTANLNGTGSSANNVLVGNSGANNLSGGGGNDQLDGGDGNDSLDGGSGPDILTGGRGHDTLAGGGDADHLDGGEGDDSLDGGAGADVLLAGVGNDSLVGGGEADHLDAGDGNDTLDGGSGNDVLLAGAGTDQLTGGGNADTLDAGSGNDSLDGGTGDDVLLGGEGDDTLLGGGDNDVLDGGTGNDLLKGMSGHDLVRFGTGSGQDTIQNPGGGTDRVEFGTGLDPFQLILSRQVNDLRIAVYGSTDTLTVRDWYTGAGNQTEVVQAGNGQQLLNTQVDQLIQAMAGFTQQTGLTWEQGLDQRPQDVQTVLAASWQ